jgi:hypothetical protein
MIFPVFVRILNCLKSIGPLSMFFSYCRCFEMFVKDGFFISFVRLEKRGFFGWYFIINRL